MLARVNGRDIVALIRRVARRVIAGLALLPLLAVATRAAAEERVPAASAARSLLLSGKYDEAIEAYSALAQEAPVVATLGLVRAHASRGQRNEVSRLLTEAMTAHAEEARLPAEAARWALERGDLSTADELASRALELDGDLLLARWVRGEVARMSGRLDEANAAYKGLVDFYNDHDVTDVESLEWIGLGAAQFARWNRLSDQFHFLVNELYPDAIKLDRAWWPAHYQAGLLFLEKYNRADAARELKAALVLNPHAAEVHAALARLAVQNYELETARQAADRALELNPCNLDAQLARADILLANFQAQEAIAVGEQACRLHPASVVIAGRLAGAYLAVDGVPQDLSGTRAGQVIARVTAANPHCGEFFASLGAALDLSRKYPAAARYYREAIARMPQLIEPYGELGIVLMRLGDEPEARQQLERAAEFDPFHVRVDNLLKVLDVLDGYAVLETDHFVIKFDRGQDELLAKYAARYLEEDVYPQLCKQFGYEPREKSLFEIFNRARNTGGHGWFSARMVGLPFVHTVGACAGKVVALASPNDMPKKYNWARVLKHEFVHVLNLQQTDFSIPHWFTEALAVGSEGAARPQIWNQLLAERVPKNQLFDLDTINLGFVRPQSSLDWQMAYCQADLYARYITQQYGDGALAKMLTAYRDNLDTAGALRREFGVEVKDFERDYQEFVRQTAANAGARTTANEPLAELERQHQAQPQDHLVTVRLAAACLAQRDYPRARQLAESVLRDPQSSQLAAYVLARVCLTAGDNQQALKLLTEHLNRAAPDENLLNLLAGLHYKAEQYEQAETLYELGRQRQPAAIEWPRALARVYLAQGNDVKLAHALEQLAGLDPDDLTIRKKLAQLALAAKDYRAAERWGRETLYIDVMDADVHRLLGDASAGLSDVDNALAEYEVSVKLGSKDPAVFLALAQLSVQVKNIDRAKEALKKVLELDPGNAQAVQLLGEMAR